MKPLVLSILSLALLTGSVAKAQPTNIQYSASFDEPEDGWNKVMQLSNGNTFLYNFNRDGISIKVYDNSKKIISTKNLKSKVWDAREMKVSTIEGIYEIAGKPVVFLQQMLERTPTLFRIVLDPATGAIVNEEQISVLDKYSFGAGYAMAFGKVDAADFYVQKDPLSDCYAVVNFNSFTSESDKRIEVVHYNGEHKEIYRTPYDAQGFKYLRFVGMTVDADKRVFLCTYGYNTEASGGKDSRVIVSRMNSTAKTIDHKKLEFTNDFKKTRALMQFNPGTKKIQLLTLTFKNSKSNAFTGRGKTFYTVLMNTIEPEDLTITSKPLNADNADGYAKSNLKLAGGFSGLPQQMVINPDNSTTVLMEEMMHIEIRKSNSSIPFGPSLGPVYYRTELNAIGTAEYDTDGNEKSGIAIDKSQRANGRIDPLYISQKGNGYWALRGGYGQGIGMGGLNNNAFMSYDYVNTGNNAYILYNDYPENFDKPVGKKMKEVVAISDANTVACSVTGNKVEKFYLFGTPKDDDYSKFSYIESSNYSPATKTYATLMIDRDGRKKVAKVAWVQFK